MKAELAVPRNGTIHAAFGLELLDSVYDELNRGRVEEGMGELMPGLKDLKTTSSPREWAKLVEGCLCHPLRDLLHQDPFTLRAFSKPRGYAGDAVLLDYIYGREESWPPPVAANDRAQAIFEFLTATPACEGVRARRGYVADLVDNLMEECHRPHVLSIACGHLREAHLCSAVKRKKFGRLVALDSDSESLKEVERCYGRYGVEPCVASIRQLLTQNFQLGQFDVVYSTGLFDYLQQTTAQRLAWVMFQMLRPGGKLLVANFMPGIADIGYMESYMDWKLIFRTRHELVDVAANIPQERMREIRIFAEENQNIIFLQVTKQ